MVFLIVAFLITPARFFCFNLANKTKMVTVTGTARSKTPRMAKTVTVMFDVFQVF